MNGRWMGLFVPIAAVILLLRCAEPAAPPDETPTEPPISRLDAFVANSIGPNQVYLNDGHGNFTVRELESLKESAYSYGVALGDLDGDGHLDAFVANYGVNHVYINNGDGTFERRDVTTDDHKSCGVALGDLNGDGHIDAFVVNGHGSWEQVNRVYLNNGDGTFEGHDVNADAHRSCAVALGNLTGSLHPDALVINWMPPYVRLYRNMGFVPGVDPFEGETLDVPVLFWGAGTAVALGDMNWDGTTDAFIGRCKFDMVKGDILYFNYDGTELVSRVTTSDLGDTTGVALGDLDGDGDLDVFTIHMDPPHRTYLNYVKPTGYGSNTCEFTAYDASEMDDDHDSCGVALGDLDGDGDLDAFVANRLSNRVYLNNGLGTHFEGRDASSDPSNSFWDSEAVALGDLDGK